MSFVNLTKSEAAKRRVRVVALVMELPEGTVQEHGRHLSLEVRGKRFAWYLEDHHDDRRLALNCKAPRGASQSLANADSEKFHIPKYLGHHGWLGVWLDLPAIDWSEVADLLADAYRMTAPRTLVACM